jgi:DNA-binding response OmpR family regulator
MSTKKHLMLVEDDTNLGNMIFDSLEINDYEVTLFRNGEEAWNHFERSKFDMLLLDIMMPKRDGISLAREIRKVDAQIPIIFLTAKGQKEDKILGFKVGADDYLTKPFEVDELVARIEAIFRRTQKGVNTTGTTEFFLGKYTFNLNTRTLSFGEETQKLTTKESGLLEQLCIQQNGVLTREIALKAVWGSDNYFTGRSMDVYITKIRKYLSRDTNIEIQNIHGEGYKLVVSQG